MAGAILTLFNSMVASPLLAGVTQLYGEENLAATPTPPRVVWVPDSGTYGPPTGYAGDGLNNPRMIWLRAEMIEAHIWAAATTPNPQPQDHADACELLTQSVVQAIHLQMFTGYWYRARRGAWDRGKNAINRFGRGYTLFVEVTIPVTMTAFEEAVVLSTAITPVITT